MIVEITKLKNNVLMNGLDVHKVALQSSNIKDSKKNLEDMNKML